GHEEIGEMHVNSVAAACLPVNVRCAIRRLARLQERRTRGHSGVAGTPCPGLWQTHDRPAANLDLAVFVRAAATTEPAALHRGRRFVPAAALHDAPVEDHLDAALLPEQHTQRVVELSTPLRPDEHEPLHGPSCQSSAGRWWVHGRTRSKAAEARSTVTSSKRRPTI